MKIFYLLLLFVALSCSKSSDDKICWECNIAASGSGPAPGKVDICNDSEQQPTSYKDQQGNSYGGFTCVKK